jgi:hypothetical protein
MQAYENKTQRMLGKTVDDEPVCITNYDYER